MSLSYHTEYCLGCRGIVRRTYTGIWAYPAIFIDLFVMFTLGVVFTLVRLALLTVFRLLMMVAYILTLPFRGLHWVATRLGHPGDPAEMPEQPSVVKPAWQGFSDI